MNDTNNRSNIALILGGSGSGKSAFAEKLVLGCGEHPRYYIATMQVYGEEGKEKVLRHHRLRAGKGFATLEMQTHIGAAVEEILKKDAVVLVECLSNLVANEMFLPDGSMTPWDEVVNRVCDEIQLLSGAVEKLFIVSNNVFEDGIEYDFGTSQYQRALGEIHARVAKMAYRVTELVIGIPVEIKNEV